MSLSGIALIVVVIFLEILIVRLLDSFWPSEAGQRIIIVGAIILDIALIAWLSTVGGQNPVAIIKDLPEGSKVAYQLPLHGEYKNLDDDTDLWVYVYLPSADKYDFYEAVLYYNAKEWKTPGLLVGSRDESDAGKSFELGPTEINVIAGFIFFI